MKKRKKTIKWKIGGKKVLATMVAASMFLGSEPEFVHVITKTEISETATAEQVIEQTDGDGTYTIIIKCNIHNKYFVYIWF